MMSDFLQRMFCKGQVIRATFSLNLSHCKLKSVVVRFTTFALNLLRNNFNVANYGNIPEFYFLQQTFNFITNLPWRVITLVIGLQVKQSIEDCKDMEHWHQHCQVL